MVNSTNRVKLTSAMLQELQKVFVEFSKSLEQVTAKFNAEVLQESGTASAR